MALISRHKYIQVNSFAILLGYDVVEKLTIFAMTKHLTLCQFVGSIPKELWGGQYVCSGGTPAHNRYRFDGDGTLTGVLFKCIGSQVDPCFVSKFLLTDVYLSGRSLSSPLLPSISTLVTSTIPLHVLLKAIFLANTNILFHDQQALATCESGPPLEAFFEEWTTGHPRVDPITSELILFGSSFLPPYVHYTVILSSGTALPSLLSAPVPIRSPKMMHDFGVSLQHTVILDLPLTLDPLNIARGKPIVEFYPEGRSKFGVFPRYHLALVRWFESSACTISHTANTWSNETAVNFLACCFVSAKCVYIAGDISLPPSCIDSEDVCQLYYYRVPLSPHDATPSIYPSISHSASMQDAQYVYGCTMRSGSFDAALGAAKINCLARYQLSICHGGVVDSRQVVEILASTDEVNPIEIFEMPRGWYAQECSFVSKQEAKSEANSYLLAYVFDETPNCARSELCILNADTMNEVIIPYGLHGNFFSEVQIASQRPSRPGQTVSLHNNAMLQKLDSEASNST
ncbi:carotenoid oxygenase [Ramaria rubella]|nr:carotenoid oxygenase [Ramaria rubella]